MRRATAARKTATGIALAVTLCLVPITVGAQDTYEEQRTRAVLEARNLTEAEDADDRAIDFVRIVRDDVFIEADGGLLGWLTWANALHWLTRRSVIERELLLGPGDAYGEDLAEESMRNLRDLGIFAYVQIVPVVGEDPDRLGLLVYTRDLWSLRLEQNFQVTGSTVDNFLVQLTERNLFGHQKRGAFRFVLLPATLRFGEVYFDHRIAGGTVSLFESVELILNRDQGELEGVDASAIVRTPFYDLEQRFGFEVHANYTSEVARRISAGDIVPYDIPETEEEERIPSVWRRRNLEGAARALLRHGAGAKQTFGLGLAFRDLSVEPNAETALMPGQEQAFARDVMPLPRRQVGPLLTYELFTPSYETFHDLATYGMSETVRRGPRVQLEVAFPLRAFGSSSNSLVLQGRYKYILAGNDWLCEASVLAGSRLEDGAVVDEQLEAEVRGATPMVGPARLVGRVTWDGRRRDTSRTLVTLGGDNGLRGYVSQAFFAAGANRLRANVELRTAPFVLGSVHFGAALFYDVGAVYESVDDITLHHAVGLGLRVLAPQLNRSPFRFDFGVPAEGGLTTVPSFGASQAVPLTELEDSLAQ